MNSSLPVRIALDSACSFILGLQTLIKELIVSYEIKLV